LCGLPLWHLLSCPSEEQNKLGVLDKLRKVGNYVRKGWRSTAPDSYFQYKRGRERERKEAERGRGESDRSAQREREEVQREREYDERYEAERAAEEPQTKAPRDDTSGSSSPTGSS
jgi:hypothetical protein